MKIEQETKWIIDDLTEFSVDDDVEVILTSGEKIIGTIDWMDGGEATVDSEKMCNVMISIDDVEEISHVDLSN